MINNFAAVKYFQYKHSLKSRATARSYKASDDDDILTKLKAPTVKEFWLDKEIVTVFMTVLIISNGSLSLTLSIHLSIQALVFV